ncbi:MAG: hypothetical protein K9H26_08360 [Prolixibacteraceae bacterium]|nr:hypothetical protein [Prolixibacteraceae bacterium]
MGNRSAIPLYKKIGIYIIPFLSLLAGLLIFAKAAPFYVKSIDPEYPYLINGLNCALLRFDMIGHTDHPGTPFQLFCGIVMRLTYMFAGKGWSMSVDVMQRPEFYLSAVSVSLTVIQAVLLAVIGKIGAKNLSLSGIIILQLTPFFNEDFFRLFERCNPERFMVITMLLFIVVWIKYYVSVDQNQRKFAVWSGIILAMGFATKFNYLPVLILPLFLLQNWKDRGVYAGVGVISFMLFLAPIWGKFREYRSFISDIVKHDGLYGSGSEQVFNATVFFHNLKMIIVNNPEISIFFVLVLALLVILFREKIKDKKRILFFAGFLLVAVLQVLIVSKHFKNHYLLPLFLLYGVFLYETSRLIFRMVGLKNVRNLLVAVLPLFLMGMAAGKYIKAEQKDRKRDVYLMEAAGFVDRMDEQPRWFIKPSWQGAPCAENALVYGMSYCAQRHRYEGALKKRNPFVLTWEGEGKPEKNWRSSVVNLDSLLTSGIKMYVSSSPGRPDDVLIGRVEALADTLNIQLRTKVVFEQPETGIVITKLSTLENEPRVEMPEIKTVLPINREEAYVDFNTKVKNWEKQIRANEEWMKEVRQKAELRGISVDSMVYLDAAYQVRKE